MGKRGSGFVPTVPPPIAPRPTIFPLPPLSHLHSTHTTPEPPSPMPTIIRIRHQDFTIPAPYSEGHSLTAGEAQALNQLFAENVRNNVDQWVVQELAKQGFLSPDQLNDLQARISVYAEGYEFIHRNLPAKPPSPLQLAINELALARATSDGQRAGYSPDSPEVQMRYLQLQKHPGLQAEARSLLAAREKATVEALEDLF